MPFLKTILPLVEEESLVEKATVPQLKRSRSSQQSASNEHVEAEGKLKWSGSFIRTNIFVVDYIL